MVEHATFNFRVGFFFFLKIYYYSFFSFTQTSLSSTIIPTSNFFLLHFKFIYVEMSAFPDGSCFNIFFFQQYLHRHLSTGHLASRIPMGVFWSWVVLTPGEKPFLTPAFTLPIAPRRPRNGAAPLWKVSCHRHWSSDISYWTLSSWL